MPLSSVVGAQSIIKPGVCTSSTRPAVPFEGQMIYETDTDKVLVYNGSAWYANWNLPWGVQNLASVTTSDTTITTEEVQITGGSFTAVANRYYKVTYFEPNIYNGTGYWALRIRQTNLAGTVLNTSYETTGTGIDRNFMMTWIGTLSAGSTNFVATAQQTAGTGVCARGATVVAYLLVEDIGPA
jgi:hypothetical protein